MPPRVSVDEKLEALESAARAAEDSALGELIGKALADRHHRVAAYGAKIAEQRLVYDAIPALLEAFARFLATPVKRDPNCLAKKAIVRALCALDCDDLDFWIETITYVQLEPVWGGTVDTAADLRCNAAMGLVASGYPRALIEVARLLCDAEASVRQGAVQAISYGNPGEAELLLRLKLHAGDEDPLVMNECFLALLTIAPDESVGFVSAWLESETDEFREAAALALGESRLPAAFDALVAAWNAVLVPERLRKVLLRAAALHRSDESLAWLLGLIEEAPAVIARETVETISIFGDRERLAARVNAVLEARGDPDLAALAL